MRRLLAVLLILFPFAANAAAPAVQARATTTISAAGTSHTITRATVVSGQYQACWANFDNDTATTFTWPGTFTVIESIQETGDFVMEAAIELMGGGTGSTFTLATSASQQGMVRCYAISGANGTTTEASNTEPLAVTTIDPAGISGLTSGDYLFISVAGWDQFKSSFSAFPTGYTNTGDATGGAAGDTTLAWAEKSATGVTGDDPSAFTHATSGDQAGAITVAFHAAPSTSVVYNQSNYSLNDLVEASATGFSGTLTTITEQAGGDTISAEAGASSSAANFTTRALSEYTASGSANNTKWGVSRTWRITDGTDTADDTFTIDAPTNGSTSWFQSAITCNKGACPGDSVIEVLNFTGFAANDDLYCRTLSGTLNASAGMSDQGVLAWDSESGEIECRWFDESGVVWSAVATNTYTAPVTTCPKQLQAPLQPPIHEPLEDFSCVRIY